MHETSNYKAFYARLDSLSSNHRRLEPVEVAKLARSCGLTRMQALAEIQRHSSFINRGTSSYLHTVAKFIHYLAKNANFTAALEHNASPSIILTECIEQNVLEHVTISTASNDMVEALEAIYDGKDVSVISSNDSSTVSTRYPLVICLPVLGATSDRTDLSDGFGGETVQRLADKMTQNGLLLWLTGRGVLFHSKAQKTFERLAAGGLHTQALIDLPSGTIPGTTIECTLLALGRHRPAKRFVGALSAPELAEPMANALLAGPTKKPGASWQWLQEDDQRSYADLEKAALQKKLLPRGRYKLLELNELLADDKIVKAEKSETSNESNSPVLFVPEYAGSKVTDELEQQTVKSNAVYRVPINPEKANPRFLTMLLNGPYGFEARLANARGATIQRLSTKDLRALKLPIPDLHTQNRIARLARDMELLKTSLSEFQNAINQDWNKINDAEEKLHDLKSVLDIEKRIENWARELPYPLATIYRHYQVSPRPKEKLEKQLHFFEMTAVYLANVGASHVKALRNDWQEHLAKWFHPKGGTGIERADFGFWLHLAAVSLKDLKRITSDPKLRTQAEERAGPELVRVASDASHFSKAVDILDRARSYRNNIKGHGGHLKTSDAERFETELQQLLRDLYEATADLFRRLLLVRTGSTEVTDQGLCYEVEKLYGSDPAFDIDTVMLNPSRPARSRRLAFWMTGSETLCETLPFFRLGPPQEPQETSFYVFNRVENQGLRWISYQEARDQEFVADDEELQNLISLSGGNAR